MSQLNEWFKGWNSVKDIRRHVRQDVNAATLEKIAQAVKRETNIDVPHEVILAVIVWTWRLIGGK